MGLLFTKRLEGKGKNDMHGTWGMVDPWMMKCLVDASDGGVGGDA
jgi:hypothetical protein